MKDRERKTAERFDILNKIQKLEFELLNIEEVTEIDFDLDGFYDGINQVILLIKYNISVNQEDYFEKRKQLIQKIIEVTTNNRLKQTDDTVEDYGKHFYFVFSCNKEWK